MPMLLLRNWWILMCIEISIIVLLGISFLRREKVVGKMNITIRIKDIFSFKKIKKGINKYGGFIKDPTRSYK
jgi:hypothetical protein